MEEHSDVNRAQQRLDEMDSRLDQRVGLDPREAEEMTELYLARVDELQERLAALGVGNEELDTTVMDRVADFLKKVDVGNYGRLKDEFSTFLDEQMRLIEGIERVRAVPPEFDRLVSSLGYGHEVAGDYYAAYQRTPSSRRLSMDALNRKFTDLEAVLNRIVSVSGVSPLPHASGIMAEAFSLLVSGDVAGFNERMDKLNLEEEFHISQKAIAKNKRLEREVADLTAKVSRFDRAIEETRRDVAALQASNPYWQERQDERIAVQLKQSRDLEFKREDVGRKLTSKQEQMVENNAIIFAFQYRFGKASGAPQNETDRLLLDMSKALGDQMPADLKDELASAYERVMASGELSEFERAYYVGDASAVRLAVDEYTGTPEGERTKEQEQQVVRALETNPDLKKIREVSSVIYGKMGPVMDLLYVKGDGGALQHVTEEGAMTFEYVFELKRRVQSLSDVYNPGELRALLVNARSSLVPLKSIGGGKGASEFETLVAGVTGSLDQLETLLNEGQIETLEAMVLTDSFHKESLGEWLKRDGVVLAFAIIGGMVTFGLASGPIMAGLGLARGGYSALVVSSGLMAAGGVVGAEVGREVSDVVFDTGMESNLRRYFEGEMAVDDLLAGYGKEFVVGWASSMLFMVGGRIFLQSIARTAESSVVCASRGAQGLQNVARSVKDFAARVTPPVPGGPLAQTFLRFSSEMAEEIAEDAAQNIHPALGVGVQFWNSLDGRNLEASTDTSIGIAQVSQVVKGRDVQSKFEYAMGNEDALMDHLKKTHPDMTVSMDEHGVISGRLNATFGGKSNTHTLEFAPTNESTVMRQTLRRSVKPGEALSTSVLTQKYGVKLAKVPATYAYDSLSGGRMDRGLLLHLKADGYIIVSMNGDGSFVARKGEAVVAFQPTKALSDRDRAMVGAERGSASVEASPAETRVESGRDRRALSDVESQLSQGLIESSGLKQLLERPEMVQSLFNDLLSNKAEGISAAYRSRFGEDGTSLTAEQRLVKVLGFQGDQLTMDQKRSILEAHFVGVAGGRHIPAFDGDPEGYTTADIAAKARLLEGAGFTKEQRRQLMEELQLAGAEPAIDYAAEFSRIIRQHPRYFDEGPFFLRQGLVIDYPDLHDRYEALLHLEVCIRAEENFSASLRERADSMTQQELTDADRSVSRLYDLISSQPFSSQALETFRKDVLEDLHSTQDTLKGFFSWTGRVEVYQLTIKVKAIDAAFRQRFNLDQLIQDRDVEGLRRYADYATQLMDQYKNQPEILSHLSDRLATVNELILKAGGDKAFFDELYPDGVRSSFMQGQRGTCFLLASLQALKSQPDLMADVIRQTIRPAGWTQETGKRWEVRFLGKPEEAIIVTEKDVAEWRQSYGGVQASLGDVILERAYASYQSRYGSTLGGSRKRRGGTMIFDEVDGRKELPVDGGSPSVALGVLLGDRVMPPNSLYSEDGRTPLMRSTSRKSTLRILEEFERNPHRYAIAAGTLAPPISDSGRADQRTFETPDGVTLRHSHAYTVEAYDSTNGIVFLTNPHNTNKVLVMNVNHFLECFSTFSPVVIRPEKASPLVRLVNEGRSYASGDMFAERLRQRLSAENLYTFSGVPQGNREVLGSILNRMIRDSDSVALASILYNELLPYAQSAGITLEQP